MQSGWQLGLIQASAERKAEDSKEGNYSVFVLVYRKGWVIQGCLLSYTYMPILDHSMEKSLFTYVTLTTRWHICTPYDF